MASLFSRPFFAAFYSFFLLLIPAPGYAQLVNEYFSEVVFSDDFAADKGVWSVKSDAENLFLIQNNEYLLKRMNKETEAAISCKWKNPCYPFEMKTALKLDKNSDAKSYAGIFFMMQENKTGGLLLEVNMKKQVRIRQVIHGNYRLLTGTPETKGWIPSPSASETGKFNLVRVAYSEKNYDVYLNETLLKSFTELAYKDGDFGYIAGPGAIAHVDFISVSSVAGCTERKPEKNATIPLSPVQADTAALIRQLQDEIQKLKSENRSLRDSLNPKGN